MRTNAPALLCAANFPANTGYAWDYIERIYGLVADRLAQSGMRTFVAYPRIDAPPRALDGTAAEPVILDASLSSSVSIAQTSLFARRHGVRSLYLTDRPVVSLAYAALRAAGVKQIVVHDHSGGLGGAVTGARRMVKWVAARTPWLTSDAVVSVSQFVAERYRAALVPPERIHCIPNAVATQRQRSHSLRAELGIDPQTPLVVAACRATEEKGVEDLLLAFDALEEPAPPKPWLAFLGDGAALPRLRALRKTLRSRERIALLGYRPGAADWLADADVAVVASRAPEAFCLSAAEPLLRSVPVVATRVGAIPEVIVHEQTGLLVEPRAPSQLAAAISRLLTDRTLARRLARNGRAQIRERFSLERKIEALLPLLERRLEPAPSPRGAA